VGTGSGTETTAPPGTAPAAPTGIGTTGPLPPVNMRPGVGPGMGPGGGQQPVYGRGIVISAVVAALLFGLAITANGDPTGSGVPLAQTTNLLYWGLAMIAIAVAGIGAQFAEQTAALAAAAVGHPRPATAMATAWTVPVVATFAAVMLVATYHNNTMLLLGPLIAFVGVAGALLSRDLLDDAGEATLRTATTIHTLIIHAAAFLALSVVYYNKLSLWVAAPLVGLIGGFLILEALERGGIGPQRRSFYALIGGAVMAEAALALNWWPTHSWTGGAVLLVCFYLAAGVLLARAQRTTLRTRDLIEFGLVGLIAFLVLAATA